MRWYTNGYENISDFHKAFADFRNSNLTLINTLPKTQLDKKSKNYKTKIQIGCFFGGSRIKKTI